MTRTATYLAAVFFFMNCFVAQADPLSMEDANFTKWLSENGVNYQSRVSLDWMIAQAHTTCTMLDQSPTAATYKATISRLAGGPPNFTQREADLTVYSAIQSYCHDHVNLVFP